VYVWLFGVILKKIVVYWVRLESHWRKISFIIF